MFESTGNYTLEDLEDTHIIQVVFEHSQEGMLNSFKKIILNWVM